jgi:hypothetical protein
VLIERDMRRLAVAAKRQGASLRAVDEREMDAAAVDGESAQELQLPFTPLPPFTYCLFRAHCSRKQYLCFLPELEVSRS